MYVLIQFNTQYDVNRQYGRVMPSLEELKFDGFKLHHSAIHKGYVSRKHPEGIIVPYVGRYGHGYKRFLPRYDTSQFVTVEYWIIPVERG